MASVGVALLARDTDGARFRTAEGVLALTFWGDRILRVTMLREGAERAADVALVGKPATVAWTLDQEADRY
ncbi:hypothetical protein ACP0HG_25925, partial [Escherichia coli]|uniref:hypothetical protein n=1 Tax=Escherichia coli TaxID=562 RepID=UPI003CF664AF